MWKSFREALAGERRGRICGVLFGFFCGFLYLFSGFWDMLIFAIVVYFGYYIGRRVDEGRPPLDFRPLLSRVTRRWRGF